MDRIDALHGALVADAASLGLHWLYEQSHIETLAAGGDVLFRQPDAAVYEGRKAYFAQAGRRAGELSQYGESARLVGELALGGGYSTNAHRQRFLDAFGPCGEFVGYADRPTKALVARILTDGEAVPDASGVDDDQMPVLAVVPGLFAANASHDTLQAAARVLSVNDDALSAVLLVHDVLERLADGTSLGPALRAVADAAPGSLGESLRAALEASGDDALAVAERFGMACHVGQGLPVVWHLLAGARDYESVVRGNVRCGGDSCGRALALGAAAGLAFGVPPALHARLAPDVRASLAAVS